MKDGRLLVPVLILWAAFAALASGWPSRTQAQQISADNLGKTYEAEIRPLLERYCYECHGTDLPEAEINLVAFATWADARKAPQTWQTISEMLGGRLMPPEDANQPTEEQRKQLTDWVAGYLKLEAASRAGDPGRVVLRRLNNAEYTYTIRDITGIASLAPAREFPADSAAGEGFTNTGSALVMSPALMTKYLDAAKDIASHAVLVPDGFRFSPQNTRRDWTNEILAEIRQLYREHTDALGGGAIDAEGTSSDPNEGGRIPLQKYLTATLAERDSISNGAMTIEEVAQKHGLSAKYLGSLWSKLTSSEPSLALDPIRARWNAAQPAEVAALAAEIGVWQQALWKFAPVGHIGKIGGPKRWLEAVNPVVTTQELRLKIPPTEDGAEVEISLVATDLGDGNEQDFVIWQQPRLVAPGRADLLLRDVREVSRDLAVRRQRMFAKAANYLQAADEAAIADGVADPAQLAEKHGVEEASLRAWLDYLGIGSAKAVEPTSHFTNQLKNVAGYDFVNGWGTHETPLLLANSSDQDVRVPGNLKAHSIALHPSPSLRAVVGWRSPVSATMRVEGSVKHAHPECGNGVSWFLELRRGATRQRLAEGIAHGDNEVQLGPLENLAIRFGDLVSLHIGPRDGDHGCDLTAVELKLTADDQRSWSLARDVSSNVLAGNPHADHFGNEPIWHFYTEPERGDVSGPLIPAGSLLAKWRIAKDDAEKTALASAVQNLLIAGPPVSKDDPDALLYRQLASLGGPLFSSSYQSSKTPDDDAGPTEATATESGASASEGIGLDPTIFGKHPNGSKIDAASLSIRAPAVLKLRLPADLVAGCEFVTTGILHAETGTDGSVQLNVLVSPVPEKPNDLPKGISAEADAALSTGTGAISSTMPILVTESGTAKARIESALEEFRQLFPTALCYTQIVPIDEVVTLTLFYREDDHLARLMLDDSEKTKLDRLWDELRYVSEEALILVDAFEQLIEYATQDRDPSLFEPLREPINDRAAAFRQRLIDTEPKHLDELVRFASRAYRRPLSTDEIDELRSLYASLRKQDIAHEDSFRLMLARVLVAPAFLYRLEIPPSGSEQKPISDGELANRLSYFLWSSCSDDELTKIAVAGRLQDTDTLTAQTTRMLQDAKCRRLATEFACHWLHIYDFKNFDEKSERHFPSFSGLRNSMYEESIRFFTHLFQSNGSVLDILDADYTFLNDELAKHYEIPNVTGGDWRRVDGVKAFSRGGILAQATTLSRQSGASRTSPVLRGNWISEVLLGERLPRPPQGVPPLPDDEAATEGLTVRQLVEKHASDPKCNVCHKRIDPLGFSLEGFDAIGRRRDKDLGSRPVETQVTIGGSAFEGLDGLRHYLVSVRRDAFLRQFCRKLLGYALGRSIQLSDEPLLDEMRVELETNDFKIHSAVKTIVHSRQFREIRGRDMAFNE